MSEGRWRDEAACATRSDTPDFFEGGRDGQTIAAGWCRRWCSVRETCLRRSLEDEELFGVWGGVSQYDRRRALNVDTRGRHTQGEVRCPSCRSRRVEVDRVRRRKVEAVCGRCAFSWLRYRDER